MITETAGSERSGQHQRSTASPLCENISQGISHKLRILLSGRQLFQLQFSQNLKEPENIGIETVL